MNFALPALFSAGSGRIPGPALPALGKALYGDFATTSDVCDR
jgi:hypothetical protein